MVARAITTVAEFLASPSRALLLDFSPAQEVLRRGLPLGARHVPPTDLKSPSGSVISAAAFAALTSRAGVRHSVPVVISSHSPVFAARLWWAFRLFGKTDVSVLDGGAAAWLAAGAPVMHEAPAPATAPTSADAFVPAAAHAAGLLASAGDVLDACARADGPQIIDARSPEEYAGGHVPGARSVPFSSLLARAGHYLDAPALRGVFAAAGVDAERPSIVYCGVGMRASVGVLALRLAAPGAPPAANYDGSWHDWATQALPQVRGPSPK
jgi:thiosulfate/3-mercaptopyruvate sulfurtransferase